VELRHALVDRLEGVVGAVGETHLTAAIARIGDLRRHRLQVIDRPAARARSTRSPRDASMAFRASPWAVVRGKPSSRKPAAQSGREVRSAIISITMASPTRPPDFITASTWRPSDVAFFTCSRSMSPVDSCGMP
jgi:hypothetical protein